MKVCMYCNATEGNPHGPFGCPADPATQKHLIEKFGPMAAIGNPYIEKVDPPFNGEIRPWGGFQILAENRESAPFWKLKRIVVNANESLSLQKHDHRTEFWMATKGTGIAWVEYGQDLLNCGFGVTSGRNVLHIPLGARHRVQALDQGLEFFELATSDARPIDESDITRYEDKYGRV